MAARPGEDGMMERGRLFGSRTLKSGAGSKAWGQVHNEMSRMCRGRLDLSVTKRPSPREEAVSAQSQQDACILLRLSLNPVESGNSHYDED